MSHLPSSLRLLASLTIRLIAAVGLVGAVLAVCLALDGCAQKAQWKQTGEYLAARAMAIAGRAVLNATVETAVNDADFLDSTAAGLRSEAIVTSSDVERLVRIWAPEGDQRYEHLAVQLADTHREAARGADARIVVEALATGLNRAAASEREP